MEPVGGTRDTIEATGALMPECGNTSPSPGPPGDALYRTGAISGPQCEHRRQHFVALHCDAYAGGFHGLIDDVVIRIGALSPADIKGAYERGR